MKRIYFQRVVNVVKCVTGTIETFCPSFCSSQAFQGCVFIFLLQFYPCKRTSSPNHVELFSILMYNCFIRLEHVVLGLSVECCPLVYVGDTGRGCCFQSQNFISIYIYISTKYKEYNYCYNSHIFNPLTGLDNNYYHN